MFIVMFIRNRAPPLDTTSLAVEHILASLMYVCLCATTSAIYRGNFDILFVRVENTFALALYHYALVFIFRNTYNNSKKLQTVCKEAICIPSSQNK